MTLTAFGFKRKRYDEILLELEKQARELFGADVNLSDRSPIGQWVKLIAFQRAEENEALEDLYNADFVDTATGISLDHVCKRIGIARISAAYAKTTVDFIVDTGVSIKKGTLISTKNNVQFVALTEGYEIGKKVSVEVVAEIPGPIGNVPANTITEILTPLPGVYSVNNPDAATGGRNVETDAEFRERYYASLSKGGGASIPSIRAALLEVDGVTDAIVEENDTMNENESGIPPKSIAPFVYGGEDSDIAQIIFTQKAAGIHSFGQTIIDVTDSIGKVHKIGFSRPENIPIDLKITLVKNSKYPENGDSQVITNVIKYIGGIDADSTEYDGLGLKGDVVHFKVISAISSIPGIDDVRVQLSKDDGLSFEETNIIVGNTSIARTHYTKVVIE